MADESNVSPLARVVRWAALAVLISVAVALYFRDGRRVAPLGGAAASPAPATPGAPAIRPPSSR